MNAYFHVQSGDWLLNGFLLHASYVNPVILTRGKINILFTGLGRSVQRKRLPTTTCALGPYIQELGGSSRLSALGGGIA